LHCFILLFFQAFYGFLFSNIYLIYQGTISISTKFPKYFNKFTLYIILLTIIVLFPIGSCLSNAVSFVFSTYIIKEDAVITGFDLYVHNCLHVIFCDGYYNLIVSK
jgi:hypothetical protein